MSYNPTNERLIYFISLFLPRRLEAKILTRTLRQLILQNMKTLKFAKYSGNGNDFIIIREEDKPSPEVMEKLCHRHFGVGADGIITYGPSTKGDSTMRIFNADGGEAEMCGNAVRCLATYLDKISETKKDLYRIETMNAVYPISRQGNTFALEMTEIKDKNIYDLSDFNEFKNSFFINTGVPHLVFLTDDAKAVDIKKIGSHYRHQARFPNGTNVTVVQVLDLVNKTAFARTYERGVEDETHSCGTGLTATALALSHWLGWKGEVKLKTKGGNQLVTLSEKVLYSGEVFECFTGEVTV